MKKFIYKSSCAALLALFVMSCDKGFDDLNVNPTKSSELGVEFELPQAILYTAGQRYESWRGNFIYCSTMIQHLANTQGYWSGDKYFYNAAYSSAYWDANYPQGIKAIEDMMYQLESTELTSTPEYAMVRILRVFAYHRLTDLYGDIPYTEAGKAFTEANSRPAYDSQESIYADMLKELDEAAASLGTGTADIGAADILFGGNQAKWKKWAYSLMLRLGLRMVKVDEAAAQQWATTAISGGVMESNEDIAYVRHEEGNGIVQNGNGEVFSADRSARISTTFLDILQGDPRMRIFAALPPDDDGNVDEDPANQKGLPNGLDGTTIQDYVGGDDLGTYSEPNSNYLQGEDAPMFWQTYAEVEFMLAEAAVRWGLAGGDPEVHYNAGVTASMKQLSLYAQNVEVTETVGGTVITDDEINDYLIANPYDAGNALEQINTQYWVATFLNEYEAYANWRRTGFPVLTPVDYAGNQSNGTIPRRLIYPTNEAVLNTENYNAAISAQGPDLLTTRMWWDAE